MKRLLIIGEMVIFIVALLITKHGPDTFEDRRTLLKENPVLLLIAHPDDEIMFFSPSLEALQSDRLFLLCVSNGGFLGGGELRAAEFRRVCGFLGLPQENCKMLSSEDLEDNPNVKWDTNLVVREVEKVLLTGARWTVLTFDEYGSSGHLNHISLYESLKECNCSWADQKFKLHSFSFFETVWTMSWSGLSLWKNCDLLFVAKQDSTLAVDAMKLYKSQRTWYREVFLRISATTRLNCLYSF